MPQNAGKRLVEAFSKQLEKIEYFSSMKNVSPNVAVHELRKSFKRMRALIRFYHFRSDDIFVDSKNQLKYFGRSFSRMRESFVNLQVFEKMSNSDVLIAEKKIKAAREKLTQNNKQLIEKGFLETEGYLPVQKFGQSLNAQLDVLKENQPTINEIIKELQNSYIEAHEIFKDLSPDSSPVSFHELRKKLKRLMYQFEFIRYTQPRYFKSKTFQLNRITEQLGEDHDFFVFINEIKNGAYDFDSEEIEILENKIQHLREVNFVKLFPRLKQFFNESPPAFSSKLEINIKGKMK